MRKEINIDELNKNQDVTNVGELIAWLQKFPDNTPVGFGYASIEAYTELKDDGSTEVRITVDELA